LGALIEGKPFVAVGLSEELSKTRSLDANAIIKTVVAPLIKGGGGGQKTLATAGGQDGTQLSEVIKAVRSLL
jgi:alanyl-tRNA synthetase